MKKPIRWLAVVLSSLGFSQRVVCEPAVPASDGFKLVTDLSKLPLDIGVWLGKGKVEVVHDLQGLEFIEEKEQERWLPKTDVGGKEHPWRRMIFMVTWVNGDGASIGRPLRVSFNADSGKIWYLHMPVKPQSSMPKVGSIAAGDTFQTCVAKLGQPVNDVQTAPVTREAAWQMGSTTYRINYSSEAYRDFNQAFRAGEIDLISVYRKDLAPPGFDDKPTVYDPSKGW
ncbi:MAG: hypothetical protein ABIT37_21490 [Luteolibacter sp.]